MAGRSEGPGAIAGRGLRWRHSAHATPWAGIIAMVCIGGLVACGGRGTPTPAEVAIAVAESEDIGKTIQSRQWEITLVDSPYTTKQVGRGTAKNYQSYSLGTLEAEGVFLVVPVSLTNGADEMRMFTKGSSQLVATDAQGRETPLAGGPAHMTLVYNSDDWGEQENQLVQNPIDAGVTWEGPLVFDAPEDATGLKISFKGSDESIDLGL